MAIPENLVSIIIPAFNAEVTIATCIQSCINQWHHSIEIIVVNDGSTDKTLEIVRSFEDKRIVILNQPNHGCSQAKNSGFNVSSGEFIQYLDADDFLSPDKIKEQLDCIRNTPYDIAVCKTLVVDGEDADSEIDTELISKEGTGLQFLLRLWGAEGITGMVQPNAYLISRKLAELVGPWDITISPNPDEDGEYFARVLLAARWVHFTRGINYYRKSLPNSLSKTVNPTRLLNQLRSIEKTFDAILRIQNTAENKLLFSRAITGIIYTNNQDKGLLIPYAKDLLKKHELDGFLILHPWKIALLAKIVGFENAMIMRGLFERLRTDVNVIPKAVFDFSSEKK